MNKLARDDEEQLIARSQHGDVDAFNQLIKQYQQIMYGTVFRLLADYDAAADVTQDAFIAAYKAIKSYRGDASFRSWLLRIGSNMACDHWRRVQRHPTASLDSIVSDEEPQSVHTLEALAATDPASNPEEYALSRELQTMIEQGLQQLPLEQRTVLVLYDIQGLSYEEVAQATQTTLGTVRSRISRGRTRLRTILQKQQSGELFPQSERLSNRKDG
jgi:RNA polymerase sigma factor, sigma-70 family